MNELAGPGSLKLFTEQYVQGICQALVVGGGSLTCSSNTQVIFFFPEDLEFSSVTNRRQKNFKGKRRVPSDIYFLSSLPSSLSSLLLSFEKGSHLSQAGLKLAAK